MSAKLFSLHLIYDADRQISCVRFSIFFLAQIDLEPCSNAHKPFPGYRASYGATGHEKGPSLVSRVRCYVPCLSRGGNDDPQQKSIRHFAWIKPTNCKHKWVKSYRVYSFFRSLASGFPHATLNFYVRPVSRYRKTLFLSPRIVTPGDTLKDL